MDTPTREVFGNIAPWMQWLFYALMAASLGVLAWQVTLRMRIYAAGRPGGLERNPRLWLARLWTHALLQRRVLRRRFAGVIHLLISSGFVVLTIGTTLLFIAHAGPVDFHHGWYYLIYELVMDTFGVALCVGCAMALYRRAFARPASLGQGLGDWWMLALLLTLGITGFLIEALRLLSIWPYTPEAAEKFGVIFAELRKTGRVIQQIDMQIGARSFRMSRFPGVADLAQFFCCLRVLARVMSWWKSAFQPRKRARLWPIC